MTDHEELTLQTERADKAQAELENFKRQAKELEQFLQAEATKKEAEIRKLKEESIMKEKNYKAQKAELTQLQTENATLKQQIATHTANTPDPAIVARSVEKVETLGKTVGQLREQLAGVREKGESEERKRLKLEEQFKEREHEWKAKEDQMRQEIEKLREIVSDLKMENQILNEKLSAMGKGEVNGKGKDRQLERKTSKKEIKLPKDQIQRIKVDQSALRQLEEANSALKEALLRSEKSGKEAKSKYQLLLQQNESLRQKILVYSQTNAASQRSLHSPYSIKPIEEEPQPSLSPRINYSCLLLTKPHYTSPFLEVQEDRNTLKIYKSSRSGTFEKSMGCSRHKLDLLAYDQERILDPIIKSVLSQTTSSHSIILYGVKRSSKKYIMAKIVSRLKELLVGLTEEEENVEAMFLKRSSEEEKNYTIRGKERNSIMEVIDCVMALGIKRDKPKEKLNVKKGQSKPKVRYFSFRTDNFSLEVASSSFTSLAFRDKMTPTAMLNNILYSKLPDILHDSLSLKHLILTLNPIVDLYEDCRNTLNTTLCRASDKSEEDQREWGTVSPVREELNDVAKKKLQNFERQSEQTSLKIRKLQDECVFYKSRFDQLQFRLKNLLNTHAGQNSYLKKSPVTLSYQKLLKYVHSVQSRTTNSLSLSQVSSMSQLMKSSHLNTEKEELDDAL